MTLVDTSVWVDFFKGVVRAQKLIALIEMNEVLLHPLVHGELLLGGLSARNAELLDSVHRCDNPDYREVYNFIAEKDLREKGIGWVDAVILYSATSLGISIFTFDEALAGYKL
jgi:predicted nucleic acid-binding protein